VNPNQEEEKQMTKERYTHIHMLFDRSGSMQGRESDVAGWYKTFIEAQRQGEGQCSVSLATFDTGSYDEVIQWSDLSGVPDTFVLEPRGGTPLLDSVARSINNLGKRLSEMKEEDRPSKVICIIQTDGQENSSKEYSLARVKELVETQQKTYSWDFLFLGADIDAFGVGAGLGVASASTARYGNNSLGYVVLADSTANAVLRSRSTGGTVSYTTAEQSLMSNTVDPGRVPDLNSVLNTLGGVVQTVNVVLTPDSNP
jgi:hypothetical protein